MPKCDYCDVYLTHDSMSVRKAHNSGRNHLRNVIDYYQQIGHEKAQSVIDSITSSYAAEGQSSSNPVLGQNPGSQPFPPPPFGLPAGGPGSLPPPPFSMPGAPPGGRGAPLPFPPPGSGLPPLPAGMSLPNMPNLPNMPAGIPFPPVPGASGSLPFPPPAGMPPLPSNFQFPPPGGLPAGIPPPPINFSQAGAPVPAPGGQPGSAPSAGGGVQNQNQIQSGSGNAYTDRR